MEKTPNLFVASIVGVFREVRRVLRSDGTCWLNCGDSYAGSAQGNKLPPGNGCAGNYTGIPEKSGDGLKPKDLCGIPWRVALALQADGWWLRSDVVWEKPNPASQRGRDRPVSSHEFIFLLTKSPEYFYAQDDVRVKTGREASWEEYESGKGTNRGADLCRLGKGYAKTSKTLTHPLGRGLRDVWRVAAAPSWSGEHSSVYPPKLVEPCVRAGCPVGGIVLDPFCGESNTGAAALKHGRYFIGIDICERNLHLSRARLSGAVECAESGEPVFEQDRLPGLERAA
jgi:DNA modification methylase